MGEDLANTVRPIAKRRDRSRLSVQFVSVVVFIADVSALISSSTLIHGVLFGWHDNSVSETYDLVLIASVLTTVLTFQSARLYHFNTIKAWPRYMDRLATMAGFAVALLFLVSLYVKFGDDFSQIWLLATSGVGVLIILPTRGLAAAFVRRQLRRGAFVRTVAIFGAGVQGRRFLERAKNHHDGVRRIVGVFDDRRTWLQPLHDTKFCGGFDQLEAEVRNGRIDEVVVALPWTAETRILKIVNRLRELPVDVYLGSDLVGHRLPTHCARIIGGLPAYQVIRMPFASWGGIVKRVIDIILAGLLLILLAPLLLVIAVAIKLDSRGPVLFRQRRYGFNNESIIIYKFRSMRHEPEAPFRQATSTDPRVTAFGHFLRRSSFDELPQLFNVLAGTMSLVGPRPHPVELNQHFAAVIEGYMGRHRVKPGITGLAQINGLRGETDTLEKMRARVEHDIHYIENWSLALDLRILALTSFKSWSGPNAY